MSVAKRLIKFLLVCVTLVNSVTVTSGQRPNKNCSPSVEEADKCARVLMFEGDRERFIPRTENDMERHCTIMNENMKCLEKHSKCYRLFPRQIFAMVVSHVKKAFKDRCTSQSGKQEFLRNMKCIKGAKESEPAHTCMDKWTVMMKLISDNYEQPDHFPGVCCSFHIMKKCLVGAVIDVCPGSVGRDTAAYIEKTITSGFSDFLDLACGRHKTIGDCHKTFPNGTREFERIMTTEVGPQNGSVLFHALKIIIQHD
ncbi:hypothetical protein HDE_11002 [Halotydeus destructor]|nr:hypothetical protein HDE_11002 [Halotydeus destructor]